MMASELVGVMANVAPLDGYSKWSKTSFTWAVYTSLPSSYNSKTVSFNDKTSGKEPTYSSVFSSAGLNSFGLSAASGAFMALQTIAPLTFTKATGSAATTADIHFGAFTSSYNPTSSGSPVGAYSSPGGVQTAAPVAGNYIHLGDVWVATASGDVGAATPDPAYATATPKHELGHVLGLYDTSTAIAHGYDSAQDNQHFSIMSYNTVLPSGHFVSEYQLYDIAAIQRYYGQNTSTASGDTTYTLSSFTNSSQPTDGSNNRYYSVWDAGGNDTIDLSAAITSADAAFIDLRPAHFSSIGHNAGLTVSGTSVTNAGIQNVSLAFGTVIENAIGTPYNDVIVGSALSKSINGGAGNDTIYGSGAAIRMATGLGATVGVLASDDGDYGYFDAGGYHSKTISADVAHTINGGDGNDVIYGSNGGDTINGGYGYDEIYGGSGNDTIDSGPDQNQSGTPDQDRIQSGAGNDVITVHTVDVIDAGSGDDIVHVLGGSVAGTLGDGNDAIDFSNSIVTSDIKGGNGNDKFTVNDTSYAVLEGEGGADYFVVSGSAGAGIEGGAGSDLYDFSLHNTGDAGSSSLSFHAGWGKDTVRTSSNDGYSTHTSSADALAHWHIDAIQFIDNPNASLTIEWNPTVYYTGPVFFGSTTYYGYGDVAIFDGSGNSLFLGGANGSWSEGGSSTFASTAALDIPNINGTVANGNNFNFVKGDPAAYNPYTGNSVPVPWTSAAAPQAKNVQSSSQANLPDGSSQMAPPAASRAATLVAEAPIATPVETKNAEMNDLSLPIVTTQPPSTVDGASSSAAIDRLTKLPTKLIGIYAPTEEANSPSTSTDNEAQLADAAAALLRNNSSRETSISYLVEQTNNHIGYAERPRQQIHYGDLPASDAVSAANYNKMIEIMAAFQSGNSIGTLDASSFRPHDLGAHGLTLTAAH